MDFKGTKGRWNHKRGKRSKYEFDNIIIDEKGNYILKWSNTGSYCHKLTIKESQANGKLISKAPEMLEMLQELVISADDMFNDGEPSETYYQLINKAEKLIKEATEL